MNDDDTNEYEINLNVAFACLNTKQNHTISS